MKERTLWRTILAILISALHLIPIYITIITSFKKIGDSSSNWILPEGFYFGNYFDALDKGSILLAFLNTIVITGSSVFFVVVLGAMAAYPLARNKSRLNNAVSLLILSLIMIPPLSLLVPLYSVMKTLSGINTYWGIVAVHVAFQLPYSIFLYTHFIKTIPLALDEAASLDGCSRFSIFHKIILPLLKPITASIIIITGVYIWNDYQFSLFFLQKANMKVITIAISSFFAQTGTDAYIAAAAAVIGALPIMILYIVLQKYFIKGTLDSAIKE